MYEAAARDPFVVARHQCSYLRAKRRRRSCQRTLTDETGGALPGVTVELLGGSEPREVITDSQGDYDFENVPSGTYQLSMRLINFAAVNHKDLKVTAGQAITKDEVMHLSLNAEVVVVGKPYRARSSRSTAAREKPISNSQRPLSNFQGIGVLWELGVEGWAIVYEVSPAARAAKTRLLNHAGLRRCRSSPIAKRQGMRKST